MSGLDCFFARLEECREKRTLTHGLHPYPAKFIPHIPRALIESYTEKGDYILDPMCGSGTSLVEASTLERQSVGADLNPIAVLASRAKTAALGWEEWRELGKLVSEVDGAVASFQLATSGWDLVDPALVPSFTNRSYWFTDQACAELAFLRQAVQGMRSPLARCVASAALSAIVVSCSRQESETRWRRVEKNLDAGEVCGRYGYRLRSYLQGIAEYERCSPKSVGVVQADAREIPLGGECIDFIVTSPPYANSHDYYLYHKLRLFWLGYDVAGVQESEIGSRNRHSDKKEGIETYLASLGTVFGEMGRVLKVGGHSAVVVADAVIRGAHYDMGTMLPRVANEAELEFVQHYKFGHKKFTSSFQRGFGTSKKKTTHVLIFKKA